MTTLVTVSVLMHLFVLVRCAQFLAGRKGSRDLDKHLVMAFATGSVFSLLITVANVLYSDQLRNILGLWSGFMIYNATVHLAIVTLMLNKVPKARRTGRNRRRSNAVG